MPNVHAFILSIALTASFIAQTTEARTPSQNYSPRVLSRVDWQADESLGITSVLPVQQTLQLNTPAPASQLSEKDLHCRESLFNHPEDFEVSRIEKFDDQGRSYVWPRRYSPKVKAIVIHHTGEHRNSEAEKLIGIERVRAIYRAHTVSNGWGDVGYHYLIDDDGTIYEGRAGGKSVVGAHVYCANVGTIGIALIGNFQLRYPREEQLKSLRWILARLSDTYDIDPTGTVSFQGKEIPTILGHRDLAATQCAGRKLQTFLPQIRALVAKGDFDSDLLAGIKESSFASNVANTLSPVGTATIALPPRGAANVQMQYRAKQQTVKAGQSIAAVQRSDPSIGIWQKRAGSRIRVRSDIRAEETLRPGDTATIQLTILAPGTPGVYTIRIGDTTYTLEVAGRRMRQ